MNRKLYSTLFLSHTYTSNSGQYRSLSKSIRKANSSIHRPIQIVSLYQSNLQVQRHFCLVRPKQCGLQSDVQIRRNVRTVKMRIYNSFSLQHYSTCDR